MSEQTEKNKKSLKIEILDKVTSLATAGFGLVAAMAWNDAIRALFSVLFPKVGNIIAQFIYALIITIIVVIITIKLGKLTDVAKNKSIKEIKE